MVGEGGVWDEPTFDSMDFALFAASIHPDATAPILDLLCDWYVWLFSVDDAIDGANESDGFAGAKRYLSRMTAMVAAPDADPADPAERGLADAWRRTVGVASPAWLARMGDDLRICLQEMRWALANIDRSRVANPIEYIDTRRLYGGMNWTADLVELGCAAELAPDLVALRPVWQLRECFGDTACLRNDVVSLRKEVEAGEALSNGVVLVQAFLGCDVGMALKVVHDLYEARRRQFDHLASVDLPEVFDDLDLPDEARRAVMRNVEAMRDWQAGDEQWIRQSDRYFPSLKPTAPPPPAPPSWQGARGLGTAAARVSGANLR